MGREILEILQIVDAWETRDIQTLIKLLSDYLENERS